MDEVIREAKSFYQALSLGKRSSEVDPSALWISNFRNNLGKAFDLGSLVDLVHFVQEANDYAQPRTPEDPFFDFVTQGHLAWLESQGHPLSSYPSMIQESHLSTPKTCFLRDGRKVSVHFLYHLCICARILDSVARPIRTVLEIGGGYGGLARLFKLFEPSVQYWIVDLPESVYFSYSFIRGNFPDAKCTVIDAEASPIGDVNGSDFVFVPVDALERIAGLSFDLAVNTASLGEMTQAAVNRYFRLLEHDVSVRYFYSLNRYGQFSGRRTFDSVEIRYELELSEWGHWGDKRGFGNIQNSGRFRYVPRSAGAGTCDYATPFDPYWSVLFWHPHGEDTFTQFDPACPPYLECLVERIPRKLLCDAQRWHMAENLFEEAMRRGSTDREWERMMWESVRVFPSEKNMAPWLRFLQNARYDEFNYFKQFQIPGAGQA